MGNCKTCAHSVFDELWGEYKCKHFEKRIYILLDSTECEHYQEKPKD